MNKRIYLLRNIVINITPCCNTKYFQTNCTNSPESKTIFLYSYTMDNYDNDIREDYIYHDLDLIDNCDMNTY